MGSQKAVDDGRRSSQLRCDLADRIAVVIRLRDLRALRANRGRPTMRPYLPALTRPAAWADGCAGTMRSLPGLEGLIKLNSSYERRALRVKDYVHSGWLEITGLERGESEFSA